MSLSVVIPSKNAVNLCVCTDAVRKHEPTARLIVVDDGVQLHSLRGRYYGRADQWVNGAKPFIFARNMNLGIKAAGSDDIVILNDDALLRTPGGFSLLARELKEHPEFGLMVPTTNCAANEQQCTPREGLYIEPGAVAFVAVVIPRRTIEAVGLLDEVFTGYGYDDTDYCYRTRKAGLKIGIHGGCFVNHSVLKPTFRGKPDWRSDLKRGEEIFTKKWGFGPEFADDPKALSV